MTFTYVPVGIVSCTVAAALLATLRHFTRSRRAAYRVTGCGAVCETALLLCSTAATPALLRMAFADTDGLGGGAPRFQTGERPAAPGLMRHAPAEVSPTLQPGDPPGASPARNSAAGRR